MYYKEATLFGTYFLYALESYKTIVEILYRGLLAVFFFFFAWGHLIIYLHMVQQKGFTRALI